MPIFEPEVSGNPNTRYTFKADWPDDFITAKPRPPRLLRVLMAGAEYRIDGQDEPVRFDRTNRRRLADLNLTEDYRWYRELLYLYDDHHVRTRFLAWVGTFVAKEDKEALDAIKACHRCSKFGAHTRQVIGGHYACNRCFKTYYHQCSNCNEFTQGISDLRPNPDGTRGRLVCTNCRNQFFRRCDHCQTWFHQDENHTENCECSSPVREFTIPNIHGDPIPQETRTKLVFGDEVVSPTGLQLMREYLYNLYDNWYRTNQGTVEDRDNIYRLGDLVYHVEPVWQTDRGNFTKRLSALAHKTHAYKIPTAVLTKIGVIAKEHTMTTEVDIEFTRDLNQSAEFFYHRGSCWWGGYFTSRCALKTNGGFGIRSFKGSKVTGRVWVMPLKRKENRYGVTLHPTFETLDAAAFLIFNGYGDMERFAPATLLGHLTGWGYKQINVRTDMHLNSNQGFLVAPGDLLDEFANNTLTLTAPQHSDLYETEQKKVTA